MVIRPYRQADWAPVLQMVQAELRLIEVQLHMKPVEGKAFVYDDGAVRGFAAVVGRELLLYVRPDSRQRGIGRALMDAIWPVVQRIDGMVITRHRVDGGGARPFYRGLGFEPIVDLYLMGYSGPSFPEPALNLVPYRDDLFAAYLQVNNAAFHELRREAGLEPNVFPEAAFANEELRREVLAKGENIWLLRSGGETVGLVELENGLIETVAVDGRLQGQGYGKALTQFAVNRLRERGVDEVLLVVGEPNLRARKLYERLGFETLQVDELSRLAR